MATEGTDQEEAGSDSLWLSLLLLAIAKPLSK